VNLLSRVSSFRRVVVQSASRQAATNASREEIYHLVVTTGLASAEELSARLEPTASTIRRELALLNGQGRLARTYGGAMALCAHPEASLRQHTGEALSRSMPSPAGRRQ